MAKNTRKRRGSRGKVKKRISKNVENNVVFGDAPKSRKKRSVESTYQKKSQVEHILLRPDTYVGSVERQDETLWVWNSKKGQMEYRKITYVPALYKVFDEILVNAADNLQRDSKMDCIKVDIDRNKGRIKVWNNGKGIPVQVHKKYKVFVPELVFGHLLTSDNYDDTDKKVTGGRNGFGAKLTNVFSKRFMIETTASGKRYKQEWSDNMGKKGKPEIKRHTGVSYTMVEFWPDLNKFGMKDLEADTVALMQRRVFDVAGTSGARCSVYLDGKKINIKTFSDYCSYYHSDEGHAYAQIGKRWQVLVAQSDGDGFMQNSFVNAISTPKGGTHVNLILDQLLDAIVSKASKQAGRGTEIKRVHVKNHLWVFINCLIENPAFSSQTKEQMTLKLSQLGSTCKLPTSFIAEILENTNIVNAVIAEAQSKMTASMDKDISRSTHGKRVLGIPKLEDANDAGGRLSKECTLILTEGDSAKSFAIAGLGAIGRDKYGVFPLRGKLLNARDMTHKQLAENKEIMNIVKILGLSFERKSAQDLRYGKVMVMADQDLDGSHIKGLIINFFHYHFPDLLKQKKGFIEEFVTPIVKVTQGQTTHQFFTMTEYEKWKKKNQDGKGWKIKYYKGLGTSTLKEAKEYFASFENHRLSFKWQDGKEGRLIDMAFNKNRADDRKNWMNKYEEGSFVDHSKNSLTYKDFINKELVQFSRYDLMRSVPSVVDGFKPTQRKVLYCCFKRNLRSDTKVAQLVGYISEHSAYHHGEQSLATTITGLAQDFVGSNNINLLVPSGQFGTRAQGGKDAASSRYIYTRLSPITRLIFPPVDDAVLDYQIEEGQRIEPYWYVPVVPLVLINGAEGIGTGWSTSVPNYNPLEVIANMRLFIRRKKMKPMQPWYRGFTGTIKKSAERGKYDCSGTFNQTSATILQITELPIRKWTQDYKEFLLGCMPGSDKKSKLQIHDVREYHNDRNVHFVVRMDSGRLKEAAKTEGIDVTFRLKNIISETNLVLFDHEGKIHKYKNVVEIMQEFAKLRLKVYEHRKKYLIQKLTLEKELLANRARFIGMIVDGKLHINNRKKQEVVRDLARLKFRKFGDTTHPKTGFEYLLMMQILTLTRERKLELERLLSLKTVELGKLKKMTIQQMWSADLDALEEAMRELFTNDVANDSKHSRGIKRKVSTVGEEDADWAGVEILKRPAAADVPKSKLWKGSKRKGRGGTGQRRRGKRVEDEEDEQEQGGNLQDGEAEDEPSVPATADGAENFTSDISRWTSGLLNVASVGMGKKKRRLK